MDWIRANTNLTFEKRIHLYLRIINFIPKTFIIIIISEQLLQIGIKKRTLLEFEPRISEL